MARDLGETIAAEVKKRRTAAGITQAVLADAVTMQESSIAAIEQGHRLPSLATLERLGKALGCPPWQLLRGEG